MQLGCLQWFLGKRDHSAQGVLSCTHGLIPIKLAVFMVTTSSSFSAWFCVSDSFLVFIPRARSSLSDRESVKVFANWTTEALHPKSQCFVYFFLCTGRASVSWCCLHRAPWSGWLKQQEFLSAGDVSPEALLRGLQMWPPVYVVSSVYMSAPWPLLVRTSHVALGAHPNNLILS